MIICRSKQELHSISFYWNSLRTLGFSAHYTRTATYSRRQRKCHLYFPGKTSGPKTLPWGLPDTTGVWLDLYLLATVYWYLLVRKSCIHVGISGLMLRVESLDIKRLWGTRSNAFKMSRNTASITCLVWSECHKWNQQVALRTSILF